LACPAVLPPPDRLPVKSADAASPTKAAARVEVTVDGRIVSVLSLDGGETLGERRRDHDSLLDFRHAQTAELFDNRLPPLLIELRIAVMRTFFDHDGERHVL